jgi:hypothetical protein
MNKALRAQMDKLIQEEQQKPVNEDLLNLLRRFASEPSSYTHLPPEERNALNTFFKEVKGLEMRELLAGDYGAEIIIDSIIVLSFEVGRQLGRHERQPPAPGM